jgi:predicted ArsR family transcriptional regulator
MPLTAKGKPCGFGSSPSVCQQTILAFLQKGGATYPELAAALHYQPRTIRKHMNALIRVGVVEGVLERDMRSRRFRLKVLQ